MTDDVALDSEVTANDPVDAQQEAEQQPEKMLSASRVEELVKKAKLKGRDSMQAELDALRAENEALKSNAGGSMGGMAVPAVDPDAITQQVLSALKDQMQKDSEERARAELEKEAQEVAKSYRAKMQTGIEHYEDFNDVMADFNPQAFPNLVFLANQVDNTPHVMYELIKNPTKLTTVAVLAEHDPKAAQNMISRISASISANQQAKAQEREVPEPYGRLSSSKTGQDSGKPTIRDYKKMYRV